MSKADEKDIHCKQSNDNGEDEKMLSYDVIFLQFNANGIVLDQKSWMKTIICVN